MDRLYGIVLFFLLAGSAIAWPLWRAQRDFPLAPIVPWLNRLPGSTVPVLAVAAAAALLMSPLSRGTWPAIVALGAGAVVIGQDQTRFQPWLYQYAVMALLLMTAFRDRSDESAARAENACRFVLISLYAWSGIHKMNAAFVAHIMPWLMSPIVARFPALAAIVTPAAYAAPLAEIAIAIAFLFRSTRRIAAALAIAMHIGLLFALGPWGLNVNAVVWPWNVAMIALVYALMWRSETDARTILWNRGWRPHLAAVVLLGACPALSFIGLWDDYAAFSLYSGNAPFGELVVSARVRDRLPAAAAPFTRELSDGDSFVSLDPWARQSLHVPVYPAERVHRAIASSLCPPAPRAGDVQLIDYRSAGWFYRVDPTPLVRRIDACVSAE